MNDGFLENIIIGGLWFLGFFLASRVIGGVIDPSGGGAVVVALCIVAAVLVMLLLHFRDYVKLKEREKSC
ncbi:MAG: hypothetical protein RSA01_09060 [Clostridium sp.]|uniref:hypothetical protein n=1 Tax=Clostridium sp. TaxID=1506 RepID=UPI002FC94349